MNKRWILLLIITAAGIWAWSQQASVMIRSFGQSPLPFEKGECSFHTRGVRIYQ